ncbi:antitoxin [Mycolicibacterium sp. S2-37]|uniref:antitoxin n=1 Tax=Mycolicibacterium sp. S2-37 TaxID=2810297 RepID=UPI001A93CF77|nr:antitoxin [Mycolicibacterium sp. S2-37]MBO0680296.1 antitoxin [Mycolicibacterium sp. S2-37]
MAIFDKVKNWVSKNPDKAGQAIEKAGNLFDQKTKGKYADKVNKAQGAARTYVNKNNPQGPINPQNPPLRP